MEKLYNFNLTIQEAQLVIEGLKELKMSRVERLIANLDSQFVAQNTPIETPKVPAYANDDVTDAAVTVKEVEG